MKSRKKICFIHVPKCGGTSLNEALRKSLSISAFSLRYYKIHAAKTMKRSEKEGQHYLSYRRKILYQKLASKRLTYLTGHAPLAPSWRSEFADEWGFITVIRNPVDRFISAFFFDKHKSSGHMKHDLSLSEYLDSKMALENGQVLLNYFTEDYNLNNAAATEEAIKNLKSFDVVGLLEDMDSFVMDCKKNLGLDLDRINQRNSNPIGKQQIQNQLKEEELKRIEEICRLDLVIYNEIRNSQTSK